MLWELMNKTCKQLHWKLWRLLIPYLEEASRKITKGIIWLEKKDNKVIGSLGNNTLHHKKASLAYALKRNRCKLWGNIQNEESLFSTCAPRLTFLKTFTHTIQKLFGDVRKKTCKHRYFVTRETIGNAQVLLLPNLRWRYC